MWWLRVNGRGMRTTFNVWRCYKTFFVISIKSNIKRVILKIKQFVKLIYDGASIIENLKKQENNFLLRRGGLMRHLSLESMPLFSI